MKGKSESKDLSLQTTEDSRGKNGNVELKGMKIKDDVKIEKFKTNDVGSKGQEIKISEPIDDFVPTCGFGNWCVLPGLQCCAKLPIFTAYYSVIAMIMMNLAFYITSQVTSLEKQFGLSSGVSGLLLSCNDIGFLIAVMFVSHFGRHAHIPRVLTGGVIVFGLAAMLMGCMQFMKPASFDDIDDIKVNDTGSESMNFLCRHTNITSPAETVSSGNHYSGSGSQWAVWMIGICIAIQGASKTPRTSLSTAYIDDNVRDKSHTGVMIGSVMTGNLLGVAMGYFVGSAIGKLPVNLKETSLTPRDPRWISAWWLGFLVFGAISVIMGIPVALFPKHMRMPDKEKPKKENALETMKDLPRSLWRILSRPVYFIILVTTATASFAGAGFGTFHPKYVETQFNIPAWKANLLLGVTSMVTGIVGTFLGGVLTTRLKLGRTGAFKFVLVALVLVIVSGVLGFWFGCHNQTVIGLDSRQRRELMSSEMSPCYCDDNQVLLTCGENGVSYLSPCHAGCRNQTDQIYGDCGQVEGGTVTPGLCQTNCPYMIPYIASFVVMSVLASQCGVPQYIILLRSVEARDKAIAVGLMTFVSAALGWLPAPIAFGRIIDMTCAKWDTSRGVQGACLLYDIDSLRIRLFSVTVAFKTVTFLLTLVAFIVCLRQERKADKTNKENEVENPEKNTL